MTHLREMYSETVLIFLSDEMHGIGASS